MAEEKADIIWSSGNLRIVSTEIEQWDEKQRETLDGFLGWADRQTDQAFMLEVRERDSQGEESWRFQWPPQDDLILRLINTIDDCEKRYRSITR